MQTAKAFGFKWFIKDFSRTG